MTLRARRRTEFARRTRHPARPSAQTVSSRQADGRGALGSPIQSPLQIGKYLVSPLPRPLDGGRFSSGVSIRCGSGSMTHDRVLRFLPEFESLEHAVRYAVAQAMAAIGPSHSAPALPTHAAG